MKVYKEIYNELTFFARKLYIPLNYIEGIKNINKGLCRKAHHLKYLNETLQKFLYNETLIILSCYDNL